MNNLPMKKLKKSLAMIALNVVVCALSSYYILKFIPSGNLTARLIGTMIPGFCSLIGSTWLILINWIRNEKGFSDPIYMFPNGMKIDLKEVIMITGLKQDGSRTYWEIYLHHSATPIRMNIPHSSDKGDQKNKSLKALEIKNEFEAAWEYYHVYHSNKSKP